MGPLLFVTDIQNAPDAVAEQWNVSVFLADALTAKTYAGKTGLSAQSCESVKQVMNVAITN